MPVLTDITAQRRGERVNIFFDGEFWSGAPVAVVVEAGLKVGREFSVEELDALAESILVREAIESCLRRLALRARTRRELADGLRERRFEEHVAERALDHLDAIGIMDEEQVARHRAESLLNRGAGPRKIQMELNRVGVDPDTRQQVMDELITHERLVESAAKVVHRRFGEPPYPRDQYQRADRWMRAQGHGQDVIGSVIGRPRDPEPGEADSDSSAGGRPARAPREVDAVALLQRKYPRAHMDAGERRRASAFLQRRGVSYDDIRLAIEALADAA